MSGDSGVLAISVDGDVVAAGADHGNIRTDHVVGCNIISGDHHDHDNGGGDDHETGDKANGGGNRWPRQETLALLKIRSDMDAVFRGTNLKGPLWQEVARKLAELGYNRSAKKCKEKFENVYKYHKRTKEGRIEKSEGKTYRFFDQLQAFESTVRQPKPQAISIAVSTPAGLPAWTSTMISSTPSVSHISTVPLTANPIFISQNAVTPISSSPISPIPAKVPVISSAQTDNPRHVLQGTNMSGNIFSSTSTSSSTASDQELMKGRYKRKRKWKYFFQRLAKEVIKKQEKLQQEFLETIEKHENERMVREEAWRMQEMARINREHEIFVQERSTAAEKDAAVIAFLQKISGQHHPTQAHDKNITTGLLSLPMSRQPLPPPLSVNSSDIHKTNSIENNSLTPDKSSSRWPKTEIQALIRLRTGLDLKYHESGPKAPMWGDISAGMRGLGYNRSAKRCKEKWENINKYFKKVKDSSVKRREDSKTCPYFHELDALYKEKKNKIQSSGSPVNDVKPNSLMEPLMVEPVRQCRPLQEDNYHPQTAAIMGTIDRTENGEKYYDEEDNEVADSGQEEDDHGDGYEMVINKPSLIENVE